MKKKLVALLITILMLLAVAAAWAEGEVTVQVDVTFGQTEAREMLAWINEFRKSNAKCWNEDDTKEEVYSGLGDLVYDYELEETAMQRATELALHYHNPPHYRPDNTKCFTAFPSGYSTAGENIAAGYTTADAAYKGWREDKYKYAGQGHRRNMLNKKFNCIGIGHVIYNGIHYWAQALAYRSSPVTTKTTACDTVKTMKIKVSPTLVASVSTENYDLECGEEADLPEIVFSMNGTWGYSEGIPYTPADASGNPSWTVSDSSKLSVSDSSMEPLAVGEVSLKAKVLGKEITSSVTITKDVAKVKLAVEAEGLVYNGMAQKPTVTVTDGDTKLKEGTDYTVEYSDNIKASDAATVTIIGAGYYTGTNEKTFTIAQAPLTVTAKDNTIIYGDTPAGAGVSYSGFVNGEDESVLDGTLAYKFSYSQYGNVGEDFTITPSGLTADNYKITYTDGALTVNPKEVGFEWSGTKLSYTGEEQAPTASVTGLVNSDKVTATVTGGKTNVGSYTATVSKLSGDKADNYKMPATVTASFEIEKAMPVVTAPTPKKDLEYTGKAQELIAAGSTKGGTLKYSLEEKGTYEDKIPTATDAGEHEVWYKAIGDSNYQDSEAKSVITVINKIASEITEKPVAKKGLIANGTSLQLVTAGSGKGGTMVYSLEENGEYKTDLPTAVNGGDYSVWYKIAGDTNHLDTAAASLKVTVKAMGMIEADGQHYMYKDGALWTDYNGLYDDPDYGCLLVQGGVANHNYTGLWNDPNYGWKLIDKGTIATNYNGLWLDETTGWWLIKNGSIDFDYTGLYSDANNTLWLIGGGQIAWDYVGLWNDAKYGWRLIDHGVIAVNYHGLWNDPTYGWWLIDGGEVAFDYNGLWNDPYCGWWLVKGGKIAFDYYGLWNDPNVGWWLIAGGRLCSDYVGLWNDPVCGWWLIDHGTIASYYHGLWNDPTYGWWLVDGGAVAFGYTGLWNDPNCGWWLINGGQIAFDYTGLWNDPNVGWWLIGNGTIASSYVGLWNDPVYGWWLIDHGTIATYYNGLWNDPTFGNWMIQNGTIVWN